jgi:hypothetical protein
MELNAATRLIANKGQEGNFVLRANGKTFWFETSKNHWGVQHGYPFEIVFHNTKERRPVKFLKTVAYIVTDEDDSGKPVVEKWAIRDLRTWDIQ